MQTYRNNPAGSCLVHQTDCTYLQLPDIAWKLICIVRLLGPPGEWNITKPAPRSVLPFGFCRQTPTSPFAVGRGVVPRNMYDGMILGLLETTAALCPWITPIRPIYFAPPLKPGYAFAADNGAQIGPENLRPSKRLGLCLIACRVNETCKTCICNACLTQPEWRNFDLAQRPFTIIRNLWCSRTNKCRPAWNLDAISRDINFGAHILVWAKGLRRCRWAAGSAAVFRHAVPTGV